MLDVHTGCRELLWGWAQAVHRLVGWGWGCQEVWKVLGTYLEMSILKIDLRHQGAGRAPRVVGGGFPDFYFGFRVIVHDVFHLPSDRRSRHLYFLCDKCKALQREKLPCPRQVRTP